MKNLLSLVGMLALAGSFALPSHVSADDKTPTDTLPTLASGMIGEVAYILGQAEATLPDGSVVPLSKGMEIPDGSRLRVKERSKLRLWLADGGMEKLGMQERDTLFIFNKYAYDPANPEATLIKKTIVEGEVTSKTGDGGEKAREHYRLNTPLAAIGVLGTEYTVRVIDGQTWVTVNAGVISMAKLGGSCQASGLGACAGGERLSEDQHGLALVVRADQPKPVFVPVTAVPGAKSAATSKAEQADAEQQAEEAAQDEQKQADKTEDKAAEKTADKSSADKAADNKQTSTDKADSKASTATEKAADKTTTQEKVTDKTAATEKTADKATASTSEKVLDKSATAVTPAVDKASVAKKADERDLLATELATKVTTTEDKKQEPVTLAAASNTPATDTTAKTSQTPVANTVAPQTSGGSVAPATSGNTSSTPPSSGTTVTLESKQPLSAGSSTTNAPLESTGALSGTTTSTTTAPLESTGALSTPTTTPTLSVSTPVSATLDSSKPMLLVSPGSDPVSGTIVSSTVTPVEVATPLVSASDGLVETSKTEATLTTATGEVVAAVTPAPAEPATPVTPTTPVVDSSLPLVRWGKYDPAVSVDGSSTVGTQVSSQYQQLAQSVTAAYVLERQKGASAVIPEQRDVAFTLGSYEASVNHSGTGVKTAATIGDARLTVSSTRNTYDTGFTLTSAVYTGNIASTGTFSNTDGTFQDDGSNPQTRLSGAVGVSGDTIGAAYVFTHQIDPLLSAEGALNWTGSLAPASTTSTTTPATSTTTTASVTPAGTTVAN